MDRVAQQAIEKEQLLKKDFSSFSTHDQLKLIDLSVKKPVRTEDAGPKGQVKQSNVRWQLNGVLNEYHTPKENLDDNHGFQSEVDEVQQRVNYLKQYSAVMARMTNFRLERLVDSLDRKLGLTGKFKYSPRAKLDMLIREINAETQKRR